MMYSELGVLSDVSDLINRCEAECREQFLEIDKISEANSLKVLNL